MKSENTIQAEIELPYEKAEALFSYDGSIPHGIRWKVSLSNRAVIGSPAGCYEHEYIATRVNGHRYPNHRIVFLLHNLRWPSVYIDHINRQKDDNRIENLREANDTQNRINVSMRKDNTSGYKGVSWHATQGKWSAQIKVFGQYKHLGNFHSAEEAHLAYLAHAVRIYGEFVDIATLKGP